LNSSKIKIRYLEKLSLHISWNQFYTHPIKITIDGFYLLVEPNTEVKYNAEREEKKQYDAKMKEVHKVEEFRKEREEYGNISIIFILLLNKLNFVESSKKAPKHKDTFMERFKLHLIRNLEVSISNIHIAFEDKKTKPNHPFAFGITLNYIKLYVSILNIICFRQSNFFFNRQQMVNGNMSYQNTIHQLSTK
jgi:vacuolar protein sorting-associated protein 13A/C